ncbi:MAG: DUF2271 domain-containing protein [Lentisphaeria bacterium]|nr:DUF2271 domain-containing protein [Lentisphaeria bacterium]
MNGKSLQSSVALRLAWAVGALLVSMLFLLVAGPGDEKLPEAFTDTLEVEPPAVIAAAAPADNRRLPMEPVDDKHRFHFSRQDVLGTSFDLTVVADDRPQAEAAEARILKEITFRATLISTYDSQSEIGRINATPYTPDTRIEVSHSLWSLLRECRKANKMSKGAFSVYAGQAIDLWRHAAESGEEPAGNELTAAVRSDRAGFKTVSSDGKKYIVRRAPGKFDLDGIGKGYVIDKAVREAVKNVEGLRGLRLNIGGEIKVWGQSTYEGGRLWRVAIADPIQPADNAPPMTHLELRNLSVATSGDYARAVTVNGRRVNHIIDPRTGRPVDHIRSATVVVPAARQADALATALCVLTAREGVRMIDSLSGAACLIVDRDGNQFRSAAFGSLEVGAGERNESAWPENFAVELQFELARSDHVSFNRHFVGAWVENAAGRRVRILALWAERDELGYVRELDEFWRNAWILAGEGTSTRRLRGISRATRRLGTYSLVWDGKSDAGRPLPQGLYSLHLDINREEGPPREREIHTHSSVDILCGDTAAANAAADKPELRGVKATYGPAGN